MDIQKKLQYYKQSGPKNAPVHHPQQQASLVALKEHFGGEICNPVSPYLKIERRYSLRQDRHDSICLDFLTKNQIPDAFDPAQCLFFDLETTGLAGGAGTFAFLIGFLYMKDDNVIVEQFFLPDYGREYELFNVLNDMFGDFDLLISYNGKSYDLPLLRNRFLINRINPATDRLIHLDLLHPVRRIWAKSFQACDLQTIERQLHLEMRENDIPGALIPQAYFDFLQTGNIHHIIRLIEHNYMDLTSLLKLVHILNKINVDPSALKGDVPALAGLAKLAYERHHDGYLDKVIDLVNGEEKSASESVKLFKSLSLKKKKDWAGACILWEDLIESENYSLLAYEELAKYHEHVSRNFGIALNYTERAIRKATLTIELTGIGTEHLTINQFKYRKNRLLKKLQMLGK